MIFKQATALKTGPAYFVFDATENCIFISNLKHRKKTAIKAWNRSEQKINAISEIEDKCDIQNRI